MEGNENQVWAETFGAVKTRHLRIVITGTPHNLSRLWEIEFYTPLESAE